LAIQKSPDVAKIFEHDQRKLPEVNESFRKSQQVGAET
jgi:hypothetical protein